MDDFFKSKVLVIVLSLIPSFNGLGLVYAGKKTNNKKWVIFGISYIVAEWVFAFTAIGVFLSLAIAVAAIIHTALICHEFESAIQQIHTQTKDYSAGAIDPVRHNVVSQNIAVMKKNVINENTQGVVEAEVNKENGIQIHDMPIDIGSVSVQGVTKDNLDIRITDTTGKLYTFKSKGNQIISFRVGASSEKSYI